MSETGPEALQQFAGGWCAAHAGPLRQALELLHAPVLRILAQGRPASVAELARASARPRADVSAALEAIPHVERDRDGAVLGLGLTLLPTPHQVTLAGSPRDLYAWCAPDALLLPWMIETAARVGSRCPATGADVVVDLSASALERVSPAGAVVSIVGTPELRRIRQEGCDHQRFFASAAAAAPWSQAHPGGVVLDVAQAFRELTRLAGRAAPGVSGACSRDRRPAGGDWP